ALIDAMLILRKKDGASLENVERITGAVRSLAPNLIRTRHPSTGLETKFSYFHAMAAPFVDGTAFPAQFSDAKALDPRIASLRDRITMIEDKTMPGRSAVVTLELKDGRSYTEHVDHPSGTPDRPMSDDEISAKFRVLATDVLPSKQSEELLYSLWTMD